MNMPAAPLENWMRAYYFACEIDIGSSGVEDFSLGEICSLTGLSWQDLAAVVFHDSPTLGGSALRQAIADRWAGGDSRRVMATHGASEANYLLMNALLSPGDEVVVADPCYPQLQSVAMGIGCRTKSWPLRFEQGYRPDLDELARLIGPKTRMLVVNFPQNPTGATLTIEQQQTLIEIVARVGIYLVWDRAFSELTYEQPPLPDPTSMYERGISMGTLSKCYGLPGMRVGWCIAAPQVLDQCVRWRDYITLHLSPLVETIAAAAISHSEALIDRRLAQARANLAILTSWLATHAGELEWVLPQGGVCMFPRLLAEIEVDALCHSLARERKVLLVPGSCFGHPQHVRLGFGGATTTLHKGLDHLEEMLVRYLGRGRLIYNPL
jgi:capreomycidine synthase